MADAIHVAQQLVVVFEEAAVDEVMAFDAGKGQREVVRGTRFDVRLVLPQEAGGAFPYRPGARGRAAHRRVVAGQAAVVGAHQVTAFHLGDCSQIGFPCVRIQRVATLLVEPLQLFPAQHEDAAQHQLGHLVRMGLRVCQRQGRTPRTAKHLPAVDAQVLAHALDVGDQVPGGVVGEFGMRGRLAAATLVEQHDAIDRRIEEAPAFRIRAAARATVQEHHRLAVRIAALLVVQRVQRRHRQHAAVERLDLGIQRTQRRRRHDGSFESTDKPPRLARAWFAGPQSPANSLPGLRMPRGSNTLRTPRIRAISAALRVLSR